MEELTFINLQYFFLLIYNWLTGEHATSISVDLLIYWQIFKIISTIIILLLLTGIVYTIIRLRQIRNEEAKEFGEVIMPQEIGEERNKKWADLLSLVESENAGNWRLAIIEADILLDELVSTMGYKGEGLGEKLKGIERSDFNTLEQAWEGHKVRNTIAHDGSGFVLTQREARRVIDLYRQVFEEFKFI
jgi:hypothetical protein